MKETQNLEKLKYPIGRFKKPETITRDQIDKWIQDIQAFPQRLEELVKGLNENELKYKYREGSWSINQVVHHCADSHINSYVRFKWTLTENTPTIKPYEESRWAELTDAKDLDISNSIMLIKSLHSRWVKLLRSLGDVELKKEFIHPEHGQRVSIVENIGIYAWHCNHHLEHIKQAITSKIY